MTEVLAGLVVVLAVAVQVVTGSGFGLVAAPLLLAVDPGLVPGPLLLLTLVVMVAAGWQDRAGLRHLDLGPAVLGAVPAAVAALVLVPALDLPRTQVLVGAAVVVGVVAALAGWQVPQQPRTLAAAGVVGGVLATLAATPGPPIVVAYRTGDAVRYRANLCLFFLVTCAVSVAALAAGGRVGTPVLLDATALLPAAAVGVVVGLAARRRITRAVRPAATWLCLVSGIVLLGRGLLA